MLSEAQRFLLNWLSKEDSSALGECHGRNLDALVERGFAAITPAPPGRDKLYGRVSLTEAGRLALRGEE